MAKITLLKERDTDKVLYPETTAEAVYFPDGQNAVRKLDALNEKLEEKADNFTLSQDLSISEERELSVTDKAKREVFVDMWNNAFNVGTYNKKLTFGYYDPEGDPERPFVGNDVRMTYEEALEVMKRPVIHVGYEYPNNIRAKTFVPCQFINQQSILADCFQQNHFVEVIQLVNYYVVNNGADPSKELINVGNTRASFQQCEYLREIRGILKLGSTEHVNIHFYNAFVSSNNVELLWVHSIQLNAHLFRLQRLKLECWQYMIANAANTKAISITVHPDVYAKLIGDNTSESFNALNDEEKAQWTSLFKLAADKQITFITL